jgi:lipoprotein signal peptidase
LNIGEQGVAFGLFSEKNGLFFLLQWQTKYTFACLFEKHTPNLITKTNIKQNSNEKTSFMHPLPVGADTGSL